MPSEPKSAADRWPTQIKFIVGNEAAERFSYYGMNGILVIFMTTYLMNSQGRLAVMSETEANGWYHTFVTCVYALPLLGAFLADAVLGRFRTVFWLSIVYCFGHFALALNDTRIGLVVGLGDVVPVDASDRARPAQIRGLVDPGPEQKREAEDRDDGQEPPDELGALVATAQESKHSSTPCDCRTGGKRDDRDAI